MADQADLGLRQGVFKEGLDRGAAGADHGGVGLHVGPDGVELAVQPDGHGTAIAVPGNFWAR